MGFSVPLDAKGLRILQSLRAWAGGRAEHRGTEPAAVAILLHDPEVDLELQEVIRWRFADLDRAADDGLDFFVLAASPDDVAPPGLLRRRRRRAMLERLAGGGFADPDPVPTDIAWPLIMSQIFDVEPSHLPGFAVFCPSAASPRITFVPIRSAPGAIDALSRMIFEARALTRGRGIDEAEFHARVRGWTIERPFVAAGIPALRAIDEGSISALDPSRPDVPPLLLPALRLRATSPDRIVLHDDPEMRGLETWLQHADRDSRLVFLAALSIWQLATSREAGQYSQFDWSGVVALLAKGFERMIAGSLMHAARKGHGIEMPRWYDLHAPGLEAVEAEVNLNLPVGRPNRSDAEAHVPWRAPTIGEAQLVYGTCVGSGHLEALSLDAPGGRATFNGRWSQIAQLRNKYVHQFIASSADAEKMRQLLADLAGIGVPEKLAEIRRTLNPREEPTRAASLVVDRFRIELRGPEVRRIRVPRGSAIEWELIDLDTPTIAVKVELESVDGVHSHPEVVVPRPANLQIWAEKLALQVLGLRNRPFDANIDSVIRALA